MTYKRKCLFRPLAEPSTALPFGARSVGHYKLEKGNKDVQLFRNFVQLFWCIDGTGSFVIDGETCYLKPEHAVFYQKGDEHIIQTETDGWNYRWFTMDGEMNSAIVASFKFPRKPFHAGRCPEELFMKLENEIFDISPFGQRNASAIVYSLLAAACGTKPKEDASDLIVKDCISFMDKNYEKPYLNINYLSEKLNIHRSTLSKIFKKKMGISPIDYLVSIRMQKALSLLKETNFTISSIAEQTGYADVNYFSKAVKKTIGLSPGQFRKQ